MINDTQAAEKERFPTRKTPRRVLRNVLTVILM